LLEISRGYVKRLGLSVAIPPRSERDDTWHEACFVATNDNSSSEDEPAMRIYDIEFDIDSFLDEMEEMQQARRQQQREREQQIHRSSDAGTSFIEPALERETE
jgi:hypothetical protein